VVAVVVVVAVGALPSVLAAHLARWVVTLHPLHSHACSAAGKWIICGLLDSSLHQPAQFGDLYDPFASFNVLYTS
jgi:hypothetical protein